MSRGVFTFGSIKSDDYDIYISGSGTHNAPAEDIERIEIPGKNGDLLIRKNRFKNIDVKYPAFTFAANEEGYAENIRKIRNILKSQVGYQRLQDTYHPDEFRMASFTAAIETSDTSILRAGKFDLIFNCKPQRFLVSGETLMSIASGKGITNPTPFNSKPLIHLVGYGQASIGSYVFTINGSTSIDMYIDCEMMEAYSVSGGIITSRNSLLAASAFPELVPGVSGITYAGTITTFEIVPRWWII